MTKQDSFVSTVPFSGFYESIHSGEVDHTLERILTDRDSGSEPAPDFIQNAAFMAIDYSAVYRRYARAYVDSFAEWLGLDGKFESMDSPREYNFTTDRVYITLTRADVARLWRGVSRADMTKAAKARFTSYDGFISGYLKRRQRTSPGPSTLGTICRTGPSGQSRPAPNIWSRAVTFAGLKCCLLRARP